MLGGQASWDDPLAEHELFLREWVGARGVQTNEVQRSWVLLPLFLHALRDAGAVDVVELGSSAGLNLVWDRYRYVYEAGSWGPAEAALTLRGEERQPLPGELFSVAPQIRSRIGIDRAPVDLRSEEAVRYLRSFVWAGQEERMARLEAAIETVRTDPPEIVQAELPQGLSELFAGLPRDGTTLVFQTAFLGYLSDEGRARVRGAIEEAGKDRDLVFVSAGSPRADNGWWGMRVYRPGREREFAGHADYHGDWLEYSF